MGQYSKIERKKLLGSNGSAVSIWHNTWHSVGPLSIFFSNRSLYDARLSNNCNVKDMMRGNDWIWPDEWKLQFPILNQVSPLTLQSDKDGTVQWKNRNGNGSAISIWHNTWHPVRPLSNFLSNRSLHDARLSNNCNVKDMIRGNDWIWPDEWKLQFPILNQVPPLTLQSDKDGRLQTQDRMMKWSSDMLLCPLCDKVSDSHDHLFFKCDFSARIWRDLRKRITTTDPDEWDQIVAICLGCVLPIIKILRFVFKDLVFCLGSTAFCLQRSCVFPWKHCVLSSKILRFALEVLRFVYFKDLAFCFGSIVFCLLQRSCVLLWKNCFLSTIKILCFVLIAFCPISIEANIAFCPRSSIAFCLTFGIAFCQASSHNVLDPTLD
nr:hypothetical protein [Tanacetum cinerariifolium]